MVNEAEMLKHLVEARNILNPDVRDKIKIESYMGSRTHLDILKYGLDLAEKMYGPYSEIQPLTAEKEFSTLIKDLKHEIKKLTPKPPKAPKPKVEVPKEPKPEVKKAKAKEPKKTPRKTRWGSDF